MNSEVDFPTEEINALYEKLLQDAGGSGYYLNTDVQFAKELVKSLILNNKRYGYPACPCRLATGDKKNDLDIICPCDYRDMDIGEFGSCYCALYISQSAYKGDRAIKSIPERRPTPEERERKRMATEKVRSGLSVPVWRCRVCGYLCGRDEPPEVCPICKAKKERFEKFM